MNKERKRKIFKKSRQEEVGPFKSSNVSERAKWAKSRSGLRVLKTEYERLDLLPFLINGFPWKPAAQVNGKAEIVQWFLGLHSKHTFSHPQDDDDDDELSGLVKWSLTVKKLSTYCNR